MFQSKLLSFGKAKAVFRHAARLYGRKSKQLNPHSRDEFHAELEELRHAILQKDKFKASELASRLQSNIKLYFSKTLFDRFLELLYGLGVTLVMAIVIRQMWFELYQIPTGSMRPTLQEKDLLLVSKNEFGINIPLSLKHLFFRPDEVKRGGIVVFTGENLDIADVDTRYFYLFPGKKQLIKRLIGKPGDALYFYGGQLYGVDKEGNDITHELQPSFLSGINHIPFITFEGKAVTSRVPENGVYSPVLLNQMNEAIAKLYATPTGGVRSEMIPVYNGDLNVTPLPNYSDYWGFRNYGMARLLKPEEAKSLGYSLDNLPPGELYLEIAHHPSVQGAKIGRDRYGRVRPMLRLSYSLLPLSGDDLKAVFQHLYTARFVVKDDYASRYEYQKKNYSPGPFSISTPGIPDGTYEMENGKIYRIGFGGMRSLLPPSHVLYHVDAQSAWIFYNGGIEFDMRYFPKTQDQPFRPQRFVYFRGGDLYSMGAPLIKRESPNLIDFVKREESRKASSPPSVPYQPFIDYGAPLTPDGNPNVDFIRRYGVTIPEKQYMVLGDNYAMSADSRDFGFVPENNLRGIPVLIFWPFGSRMGFPVQAAYALFTLPRVIVWGLVLIVSAAVWIWRKRLYTTAIIK